MALSIGSELQTETRSSQRLASASDGSLLSCTGSSKANIIEKKCQVQGSQEVQIHQTQPESPTILPAESEHACSVQELEQLEPFISSTYLIDLQHFGQCRIPKTVRARQGEEEMGTLSMKSYFYNPSDSDLESGFPIAPCAPLHRQHVSKIERVMRSINRDPSAFRDMVLESRNERTDFWLLFDWAFDLLQ